MSKRERRTTRRERLARKRADGSELFFGRTPDGKRYMMIRDEATGFQRTADVDANPELAKLVDRYETEALADRERAGKAVESVLGIS